MNIWANISNFMDHVGTLKFKDVLPYMVMIIVTLVFLVMLVLFLMPRFLLTFYVKFKIFRSPFSQKYLKIDNRTWCSYLERGNVDSSVATVLCLHGLSGSSFDYIAIGEKLSCAYHLVAIDFLNHGNSTTLNRVVEIEDLIQFVKKFIEKSGLYRRKVHLIGISLGGCIATTYVAAYPDDVASLIVCCPYLMKNEEYLTFYKPDGFVPKTKEDYVEFFDFLSSGRMKPLPPIVLTALVDYKNSIGPAQRLVGDGISKHTVTPEMLKKIEKNVLVIWGDDDKLLPPKGAEYMREHLHSVKVEYVKEGGHLMGFTHFEEMMKPITDWLAEQTVQPIIPLSQGMKNGKSYK